MKNAIMFKFILLLGYPVSRSMLNVFGKMLQYCEYPELHIQAVTGIPKRMYYNNFMIISVIWMHLLLLPLNEENNFQNLLFPNRRAPQTSAKMDVPALHTANVSRPKSQRSCLQSISRWKKIDLIRILATYK